MPEEKELLKQGVSLHYDQPRNQGTNDEIPLENMKEDFKNLHSVS